mgnify:CR=1 FL=1
MICSLILGALIGWIAGAMWVTDPTIVRLFPQAPDALPLIAGALGAALVLLAAALAMLGLGCCADKESRKGNKAHKAPADTVKPKSRRKAG